jgi:hypothetical protein
MCEPSLTVALAKGRELRLTAQTLAPGGLVVRTSLRQPGCSSSPGFEEHLMKPRQFLFPPRGSNPDQRPLVAHGKRAALSCRRAMPRGTGLVADPWPEAGRSHASLSLAQMLRPLRMVGVSSGDALAPILCRPSLRRGGDRLDRHRLRVGGAGRSFQSLDEETGICPRFRLDTCYSIRGSLRFHLDRLHLSQALRLLSLTRA